MNDLTNRLTKAKEPQISNNNFIAYTNMSSQLHPRLLTNNRKQYILSSSTNDNIQILTNKQLTSLSETLFDLKHNYDTITYDSIHQASSSNILQKKITELQQRINTDVIDMNRHQSQLSTITFTNQRKKQHIAEMSYCNQINHSQVDQLKKEIHQIRKETAMLCNEGERLDKLIEKEIHYRQGIQSKSNVIKTKLTKQQSENNLVYSEHIYQLNYYKENINQKDEFIKAMDLRKMQQEMSLRKAKNMIIDSNDKCYRNQLILIRLYNRYLALKMRRLLNKDSEIEKAYSEIRDINGTVSLKSIINICFNGNKMYNHKQELVLVNQKKNNELKAKLSLLQREYQNMVNTDVIKDSKDTNHFIKDTTLIDKELTLYTQLKEIINIHNEVNIQYTKAILALKCFNLRNRQDIETNRSNTLEESSTRNPNYITVNETNNNTLITDTAPTKTEPLESETEDRLIEGYNLFIKNSFDTFNKLFLCYSRHNFLKLAKSKGVEKSQDESDFKTNNTTANISKCPSVQYYKHLSLKNKRKNKKPALFISASLPDVNQMTHETTSRIRNCSNDKGIVKKVNEEDTIFPTELNNQRVIMHQFLSNAKKKRISFIRFNKQLQGTQLSVRSNLDFVNKY